MEETGPDDELAMALRALGHPVRLDILRILLREQQRCCCNDVMRHLPLAQSTVSQHIKVLLDAGLLERSPEGTRNRYSVRVDRLSTLTGQLKDLLAIDGAGDCRVETAGKDTN